MFFHTILRHWMVNCMHLSFTFIQNRNSLFLIDIFDAFTRYTPQAKRNEAKVLIDSRLHYLTKNFALRELPESCAKFYI